jgi:hypothetical protein
MNQTGTRSSCWFRQHAARKAEPESLTRKSCHAAGGKQIGAS